MQVIHFETTVKKRVKNVKSFLQKCSGILKVTGIPPDITIKDIREMRLSEKNFWSVSRKGNFHN